MNYIKNLGLNKILIFFISNGFLVLSFDVYCEHFQRLSSKPITYLPIIFGLIAFVLCLVVLIFYNKFGFYLFNILMLLSMCVGFLGLYFHNKWRFEMIKNLFSGGKFDFETFATFTPVLAPSSYIAIGALGLTISYFENLKSSK